MPIKPAIAFLIACLFASAFAQGEPRKLAVYVSGARDSSINKFLESKLLAAFAQSGMYVAQASGQTDADFVCWVEIAEAFGVYSILANMIESANSRVVKTGSVDSPLNSFEELAKVSDSLAGQFLQYAMPPPLAIPQGAAPLPPPAAIAEPGAVSSAAPKQCERTYNINELMFKVKDGFPAQLKDCSSKLAKEMMLAASPFGKKGAAPQPVPFMKQCAVDGIKNEIPAGFPGADRFIESVDNFVQNILNAASAGSSLDPKKLISAVGSIDINGLLGEARKLAEESCVVDEPYEPPAKPEGGGHEEGDGGGEGKSILSFGIRAGLNFSHAYAEYEDIFGSNGSSGTYGDIPGIQAGFVLDIAATNWFHIQPGIMYIQKGMEDRDGSSIASHNLEFPVLLSLKFSAFRLNAGPYVSVCLDGASNVCDFSFGLSTGLGFDIGMFYIGMLYEYGFLEHYSYSGYRHNYLYDRTLGFNLGVNL